MPQRIDSTSERLAREALSNPKYLYWCMLCSRPRKRAYCPGAARTDKGRHNTVLRMNIPFATQLEWFLNQQSDQRIENDK